MKMILMCDFFPARINDHGEELSTCTSTHMHKKGQRDVSDPDMKNFKHFVRPLSRQFHTA